jgi:DNA invertase Pin-like site-specific DNA recombinase
MQPAPACTSTVRIGYARVSGRGQDHQMQLDALTTANCREVIVETASTRGAQPRPTAALDTLRPGDTLIVYKPGRTARSIKELLVLQEDELHAREVNLEIHTGICATPLTRPG